MTIAMLAIQPPYALVAADQQYILQGYTGSEWEGVSHGFYCKVFVHPTRSFVVASAGMAVMGTQTEPRRVHDIIADTLAQPLDGSIEVVILPRLLATLEPLVREELSQDFYENTPDEQACVTLLVGLSESGSAGGGILKIGRTSSFRASLNVICPSAHTTAFIEGLRDEVRFPRPGSGPLSMARQMRRLLRDAIKQARAIAGDQADVGGDVDIAIAGPEGAKMLVDAAPTRAGRTTVKKPRRRR